MQILLWWQILILVLYAGYEILDELTITSSLSSCVFAGFLAGLVMGNVPLGLLVGAMMQLMVLGVGTFGGAPKIEATGATLVATVFSCLPELNASMAPLNPGLAVGLFAVPLALILAPVDKLARRANGFLAKRIDKGIENLSLAQIDGNFLLGGLSWALSRMIPVFVLLLVVPPFVQPLIAFLSEYAPRILQGVMVAGFVMPAVGIAILLRFLPTKKYLPYLILGFVISALLVVFSVSGGMFLFETNASGSTIFEGALSVPIILIAFLGLALAMLAYHSTTQASVSASRFSKKPTEKKPTEKKSTEKKATEKSASVSAEDTSNQKGSDQEEPDESRTGETKRSEEEGTSAEEREREESKDEKKEKSKSENAKAAAEASHLEEIWDDEL